jgi:hypothetical protein
MWYQQHGRNYVQDYFKSESLIQIVTYFYIVNAILLSSFKYIYFEEIICINDSFGNSELEIK